MMKKLKNKACIRSSLKEDGTYGLHIENIHFKNVNVYEDKDGVFCVSECGKEIPKTATKILGRAQGVKDDE